MVLRGESDNYASPKPAGRFAFWLSELKNIIGGAMNSQEAYRAFAAAGGEVTGFPMAHGTAIRPSAIGAERMARYRMADAGISQPRCWIEFHPPLNNRQ